MLGYKIGIDVGGTNTDAVLIDQDFSVLQSIKTPTTTDVETGIFTALSLLLERSLIDRRAIKYVMIGTTHATNAIIQRQNLARTAAVRICLPAGQALEPMFTWPKDLKEAIGNSYYLVHGGCEFDCRPLARSEIDVDECTYVLQEIKQQGIESIAVTSIFAPVFNDYEKAFERLAKEILGNNFPITLSSEIGKVGFLERENATILNACLVKVIEKIAKGLKIALSHHGIEAAIYFSQNDGTTISLETAKRYPILTIGSGPTNSIRGGAYLSKLSNCIVCDIGGTSTDIGVLTNGFPRESSIAVDIGGIQTNFRMPDIISIGIGGGSIVTESDGKVKVGPQSLGHRICTESIAFGGDTLTATDCLLALGLISIDHPDCMPSRLANVDKALCKKAVDIVHGDIISALHKIKTKKTELPIVLVGGGAILIQESQSSDLMFIRPENAACANSIGAAIANVSAEIDLMLSFAGKCRSEVIGHAKEQVIKRTIDAGANPETVSIVDFDEVPVPYLPSNIVRVKAKAAGEIQEQKAIFARNIS